jgi:hypothetical protein
MTKCNTCPRTWAGLGNKLSNQKWVNCGIIWSVYFTENNDKNISTSKRKRKRKRARTHTHTHINIHIYIYIYIYKDGQLRRNCVLQYS